VNATRTSLGPEPAGPDLASARVAWLVRLRWLAMAGIAAGALLGACGAYPGVHWPLMLLVAGAGTLFNAVLFARQRRRSARATTGEALFHAIVDMLLLTLVLWAAGGVRAPFVAFYVFHVAIVGMLAGVGATVVAAGVALGCAGLLALTDAVPALHIADWNPSEPWRHLADFAAFTTTVGAVAYIVTHTMRELRAREAALAAARTQAALDLAVLQGTLDQLDAGLEVIEADGTVSWRNKRAEHLARYADDPRHVESASRGSGRAPGRKGKGAVTERHRFRVPAGADGGPEAERVYERAVVVLGDRPETSGRHVNLYIDRTGATLDEQRLLIAERLASLGRVAQGVAHEMNTPLATIGALAGDMREAIKLARRAVDAEDRRRLLDDVDESAAFVLDETRRLGRITQSLLAGGDLVRSELDGEVRLAAIVERARAVVFAGARSGRSYRVEVDPEVDELSVVADPDRLVQVLVNLLQNAHDAVRESEGSHIAVRARRVAGAIELVVEDDGPGIDPEIRERLFEPFATTKKVGEGTGLGLYTSFMLMRAMSGTLVLEPRDGGGTRAVVRLPEAATRRHRTPHRVVHVDQGERP
jgi:signal transduction histidine kinase